MRIFEGTARWNGKIRVRTENHALSSISYLSFNDILPYDTVHPLDS